MDEDDAAHHLQSLQRRQLSTASAPRRPRHAGSGMAARVRERERIVTVGVGFGLY